MDRTYPATAYPIGLAWDGTHVWLADRDAAWLYAIDPAVGSRVDSIRCPSFSPVGLAFGDGCLWVSGYYEDRIYKIDLAERKVVDVIGAPGSLIIGLAWQDGYLWGCDATAKELVKFNPADGIPIRSFKSPSARPHGLAFDGTYLWVSDQYKDKIHMVDPNEGWIVLSLSASADGTQLPTCSAEERAHARSTPSFSWPWPEVPVFRPDSPPVWSSGGMMPAWTMCPTGGRKYAFRTTAGCALTETPVTENGWRTS